jgi:hypothetical protein
LSLGWHRVGILWSHCLTASPSLLGEVLSPPLHPLPRLSGCTTTQKTTITRYSASSKIVLISQVLHFIPANNSELAQFVCRPFFVPICLPVVISLSCLPAVISLSCLPAVISLSCLSSSLLCRRFFVPFCLPA